MLGLPGPKGSKQRIVKKVYRRPTRSGAMPELPKAGDVVICGDGTIGTVQSIEASAGQPRAYIMTAKGTQRRKARQLRPYVPPPPEAEPEAIPGAAEA